jgi:flagellar biogenesis protein FliO
MDAQLWRLTWALPLVIVIGLALIYWLKRMGLGSAASSLPAEPLVLSNTAVTKHTRVLVVKVNQQVFVVFESTATVAVQPTLSDAHLPAAPLLGGHPFAFPWRPSRRKPR